MNNEIQEIAGFKFKDATAREEIAKIYSSNVEEMIRNDKLTAGNIVKTLGYYSENDGGKATYKIVNDNELNVDNAFVIRLENGLKAKLVHGNIIEVEKLGFKADQTFDCGAWFENIMNNNNTITNPITLMFACKTYYFSETLIRTNLKFNIKGVSNNLGNYERKTFFKPYQENQRFVIKIGGTKDFDVGEDWHTYWITNYNFEKITFSDDNYPLLKAETKYALFCIEYASGLILDINFNNVKSRCIYMKNAWEVKFNYLSCRGGNYPVTDSAVYIDNPLQDGHSNTSALFFDFIDIEQINGTFLRTGSNCNMQNIIINSITVENGARNTSDILGKPIGLITTKDIFEECTPFALLEINSSIHGLQIGQINLHNFGNNYYYIDSNNTKGCDVILKLNGNYEVNINAISLNVCGAFQKIFGVTNNDTAIDSALIINNITYSEKTIPITFNANDDMLGYLYLELSGMVEIIRTNMNIVKNTHDFLLPGTYAGMKLKNILSNNYGRLRYGKGIMSPYAVVGQFNGETISKRLRLIKGAKISLGITPKAFASSGEVITGCYYRGTDNSYGGRQTVGFDKTTELNKTIIKSFTVTDEIVAQYPMIDIIINGVSSYVLDFIEVQYL